MSNGIELKAIIDSRIQQLKSDVKSHSQTTSKLKIRESVSKTETVQPTINIESCWVALSRKTKLYNELSQDPDYEDEECLVDFSKKDIVKDTKSPVGEEDPWVEIVDEFGRNRLVRSSSLVQDKVIQEEVILDKQYHYDPSREIRNLGTSHYKFSREEAKRQEELQELNNLRKETKQEQIKVVGQKLQKTKALEERKMRIAALKKSKSLSKSIHERMFISKDVEVEDEEIGSGSFAKVYKGKRRDVKVAVKVVRKGKLNSKILEALESEIKIQSSIIHDHLVHLHEIIRDSDSIYLVMEYCDLGDLSSYIKLKIALQESTILNFISQLSKGMEFLRINSLIHRDIKPQNILLSSQQGCQLPILKIGDFGFARALPIASMADTLCGSPLYMAPEILKGEKYDAKSDLWSLGAVFYEMVTAKPPFRANNHIELLRKIESRDGPKWNNVQVSESLKDLISKLLKKNPLERMAFEEFFLHPCVMGDSLIPIKESRQETQKVLLGDSPFPGYGVDSKIFENLKNSKVQDNDRYDFVHIKPMSVSVKWVSETPKGASSLILTCPWRMESTIDVFSLSNSDEGMIIIFGLRISCLESLIFSEFIPSADSPYEWSIVLDLCLLSLDLYQTCLDYSRSYFKSQKSISKELKDLCSWIVSRTTALIKEAEHASSLVPDKIDWDPPLVLQLVFDKISSSFCSNPPPSSVMILSCLVNLVLCDEYCQSIASRHSSEFMNSLHKQLVELNDVSK